MKSACILPGNTGKVAYFRVAIGSISIIKPEITYKAVDIAWAGEDQAHPSQWCLRN